MHFLVDFATDSSDQTLVAGEWEISQTRTDTVRATTYLSTSTPRIIVALSSSNKTHRITKFLIEGRGIEVMDIDRIIDYLIKDQSFTYKKTKMKVGLDILLKKDEDKFYVVTLYHEYSGKPGILLLTIMEQK